MDDKRFRVFAGPNGSGKTILFRQVALQFNIGYFINADTIESELKAKNYLDCSKYIARGVMQEEWTQFLRTYKGDERLVLLNFKDIYFKENYIISNQEINSYHAAIIAAFFREKLLLENHTFSFETVMSHESKVSFIDKAGKHGFKTYLYFICTKDPEINKQRIKSRVVKGGHAVPEKKTESRYYRSLELLYPAFLIADRAYVLDSSDENRNLILEKNRNEIILHQSKIPEWVGLYLLDKL